MWKIVFFNFKISSAIIFFYVSTWTPSTWKIKTKNAKKKFFFVVFLCTNYIYTKWSGFREKNISNQWSFLLEIIEKTQRNLIQKILWKSVKDSGYLLFKKFFVNVRNLRFFLQNEFWESKFFFANFPKNLIGFENWQRTVHIHCT